MDNEFLHDLLADFGPFTIKRMFGGKGLFSDGLMFALIARDRLWIKADDVTQPRFKDIGAERFSVPRKGREPVDLPYWTMPDSALDDPSEATEWARLGRNAAIRVEQSRNAAGRKRKAGDLP